MMLENVYRICDECCVGVWGVCVSPYACVNHILVSISNIHPVCVCMRAILAVWCENIMYRKCIYTRVRSSLSLCVRRRCVQFHTSSVSQLYFLFGRPHILHRQYYIQFYSVQCPMFMPMCVYCVCDEAMASCLILSFQSFKYAHFLYFVSFTSLSFFPPRPLQTHIYSRMHTSHIQCISLWRGCTF